MAETSDDSRFDSIRPYRDDEVPAAIARIMANDSCVASIINFQFRKIRFLSFFLKPLIRRYLKRKYGGLSTVAEVQSCVASFMDRMIASTTDGVVFEGFENLDRNKGYLFISNHRDIALDPAFVDLGLYRSGFNTVRIAIGDNLLRTQMAIDLMKLNQSFIVDRSSKGRELLNSLATLSDYIRLSIGENHSIWIAQREGRAKDGNDRTDPAILKMFYLSGRKQKISFADYMKSLNIVPVAISYEYDPGDAAKVHELYVKQTQGEYHKTKMEDIDSIVKGITGYKGRIHVRVGKPIEDGFSTPEELSSIIDNFIHNNYFLFPSNYISAGETEKVSQEELKNFNERMNSIPEAERDMFKAYYANPVINSRSNS